MSDAQLLQAQFTVNSIDNKKYDRALRLQADAFDGDGQMLTISLDINSELFPIGLEDRLDVMLASTLDLTGGTAAAAAAAGPKSTLWQEVVSGHKATLADQFDYVCYGKVYRSETSKANAGNIIILVSFGGLLLQLEGPSKALVNIKIGDVYLLIRKIK